MKAIAHDPGDRYGSAVELADDLRRWLDGRPVEAAPPGTLHLKTASSLVDAETVLATPALAATGLFAGYRLLLTPDGEAGGANLLRANGHILASSSYPRTLDLLAGTGATLLPLETDQISRIDAGLTCMSLRWHTPIGR